MARFYLERETDKERERERESEKNRHDERAWNTGNDCDNAASTCVCVKKKKKECSVLQEFLIMPFYPERAFVSRDRKILSSPTPAPRFFFPSVYADKSIPRSHDLTLPRGFTPLIPSGGPCHAMQIIPSFPFLFFFLSSLSFFLYF